MTRFLVQSHDWPVYTARTVRLSFLTKRGLSNGAVLHRYESGERKTIPLHVIIALGELLKNEPLFVTAQAHQEVNHSLVQNR